MKIQNFSDIEDKYDIFFVDIWGVVHDGIKPYPGTVEKLNELIDYKKVLFISNVPRPSHIVAAKFEEYKINVSKAHIISSGDVVRKTLTDIAPNKIFHIGGAKNQDILRDVPVHITSNIEDADHILISAYLESNEDLTQFDELFKQAIDLGKPFICANPDRIWVNGSLNRYCAGYFAEKVEELGGNVTYYGKPHRNIYDFALAKLGEVDHSRILMIGDTVDTDIIGAKNIGVHSALVMTGNTGEMLTEMYLSEQHTDVLKRLFNEKGAHPTWIIKGLC